MIGGILPISDKHYSLSRILLVSSRLSSLKKFNFSRHAILAYPYPAQRDFCFLPIYLTHTHKLKNMSDYYNAFVGIGLTSSDFLVFSQIGAAQFGVMPMILNENSRRQAGLEDVHQSVRVWDFFFTKATLPVAVSIMTQSIIYAIASTYLKPSTNQSLLRLAAATGFLPLPYTLTFSEEF